jgi:predicted CoA-binding protein
MKKIIQDFLDHKKVAIAGASPKKDNFGLSLMKELEKRGNQVFPVNPGYDNIEGKACCPSVKDLPSDVENLILAVPPELSEEIAEQIVDTGIRRVWMVRGVGKGAYSEKAHNTLTENQIDVVYGFCPMMFYGEGMHKFHLWLRKTFGKLPGEYLMSPD